MVLTVEMKADIAKLADALNRASAAMEQVSAKMRMMHHFRMLDGEA